MNNPPSSTPLHEAAMAAAREIFQIDGVLTTYRCAGMGHGAEEQLATIIQRHFQPLLAKVEETPAKDHVPFSNAELVAQVFALRADLAAAKAEEAQLNRELIGARAAHAAEGARSDCLISERVRLRAYLEAANKSLENERAWVTSLTKDNGILLEAADKTKAGSLAVSQAGIIEKLRDDLAAKEAALEELVQASHVFQLGAQTGQQWLLLNRAILCARSALASRADKGGAT